MKNNTIQKIREFSKFVSGLYSDGDNSQAKIQDIEFKGMHHTTFKILIQHEKEDFVLTYNKIYDIYNQGVFNNNGFQMIAPIGKPSVDLKSLTEQVSFIIENQYNDQFITEVYIDAR